MINIITDALAEFWDILTGVFNDNKAKIIRFSCFGFLFVGIIWAAANYFRADMIADTQRDLGFDSDYFIPRREDNSQLNQIANFAQALSDLRQGGEVIASTLSKINSRPFNIEGYNEAGLEALTVSENNQETRELNKSEDINIEIETQQPQQIEDIKPPIISVKAIMTMGKNNVAVVDAGGRFGIMVKRGDKLPNDSGQVIKIKSNGITVRFDNKNFEYEVAKSSVKVKKVY